MKPESEEQLPVPSMAKLPDVGPSPVFGAKPTSKKPKASSGVASFLGGGALPARENVGTKTLTGQ